MKVGKLKKDRRYDSRNDKQYGIQTYGENNNYPQQVMMIVDSSATGKPCVDVYSKFISGRGFIDKEFYRKVINRKGQTNDYILNQISRDFALIGGFAIHVNYNANYQIVEIQHVPVETLRFDKLDESGNFDKIKRHPDWGRQFLQLRKWKKEDIEEFYFFNPDPEVIEAQVMDAGGWPSYKGQILYYSNQGDKVYPLPVYDNVLTDMNTQEGVSNVSNRNARNNFLAAGMLVDFVNTDESEKQENETEKALLEFQGDEESAKIIYIQCDSKEEKPEFISFRGNNFDKDFDSTRKAIKEDIGAAFNQPPILRAEDVGSNFGADLMKNAYNYYNSVIENERLAIERVFAQIFKNWHESVNGNYEIDPLQYTYKNQDINLIPAEILGTLTVNEKRQLIGYEELDDTDNDKTLLAEKIGVGGVQAMVSITSDTNITDDQKRGMLKLLFSLSDEEVLSVIPK